MSEAWLSIQRMAKENGCITSHMVTASGISRATLFALAKSGKLVRVSRGIYALPDTVIDGYALIQSHCSKVVFSMGTALYLWGLADRVTDQIDVTVPQGTNINPVRASFENIRCHYVIPDIYPIGITTTKSPMGGEIRLYDKERCICDLFRPRNKADKQIYMQAIKGYFSDKPNTQKLIEYSKILGVENQVRTYM